MGMVEKKIADGRRMGVALADAIKKYQEAHGCSRAAATDYVILNTSIVSDAVRLEKGEAVNAQGPSPKRYWNVVESADDALQRIADAQQKADPSISRDEALTRASLSREFAEVHRREIVRKFG
jgi:hypothetical protein